jgi:hypothetical protein
VQTTLHSVSVVELHVAVNCVRILSAARQCVCGQFYVTGISAVVQVRTSFRKKLCSNLLVFSSHAKYKSCIATKECFFADGLNLTYSLAKEILMARKWLRSFPAFMLP